jgi:POT family proton-dependent oligopeptide transporter
MNVWADQFTNRYLTEAAPVPSVYPEAAAEKPPEATTAPSSEDTGRATEKRGIMDKVVDLFRPGKWISMFKLRQRAEPAGTSGPASTVSVWNPVPTAWFQSINALAIVLFAPFVAILWTALARRGWNPSIASKMAFGVLLQGLAFALMMVAGQREDQPTSTRLLTDQLPAGITVDEAQHVCAAPDFKKDPEPCQAGRLTYDPAKHLLSMRGVLPDTERDRLVRVTAPADFQEAVMKLEELTKGWKEGDKPVVLQLPSEPPGFDLRYAGFSKSAVRYDPATKKLTVAKEMADKDIKPLLVAAGNPQFRDTINTLYQQSAAFQVNPSWLLWFYILSTIAELCLSPVGLSMVSKLAPAKFATMLMGLWLLVNFFGNFAAGAFGESWGTTAPIPYFMIFAVALCGASVLLFLLVRKVEAMMHGVN